MSNKVTQKDINFFWLGIIIGIFAGLIGNLFVYYYDKFFSSFISDNILVNGLGLIIITILLFGIIMFAKNQIKPLRDY